MTEQGQQPNDPSQTETGAPGSVPDRLINLLIQLQRNRKYGDFGSPSNPTGERS